MAKTLVIKIGGKLQDDPALVLALANFVRLQDKHVCIVHGGGEKVTYWQRKLGHESAFEGGRRITRAKDMPTLRMVLSGLVNKELVSKLVGDGIAAIGLSGEDGGLLQAELLDTSSLGRVGEITMVRIELLSALFVSGFVPVISPLSRAVESGEPLNVNADDAAHAIAVALGAEELLLLTDVDGVKGADEVHRELDTEGVEKLIANNHAKGGMLPKVQAAQSAVAHGVGHVRIAGIGYLLGENSGTLIAA